MNKKVDVILIQKNLKKGKQGSIINVTRGYAFNYLIPNKIAEIATSTKIKHINMFKNIEIKKQEANQIETQLIKNRIEKIDSITMYKKTGENGLIFGSITEKEIIQWINRYTNLSINKIQIKNLEVKLIGIKNITIQINPKVNISVPLKIVPTNI
uniref:Large ribosomal subunit protein bL9c n=1 Tax=Gredgaria maugeana TaxID=2007213 RepID=A0A1Z1MNF8_9FLOR|nr:ribosomal protein L9 [Gredgaria maugeana]ARW67315.1 ribosomal protein L9 [Gredgaria maugeana]